MSISMNIDIEFCFLLQLRHDQLHGPPGGPRGEGCGGCRARGQHRHHVETVAKEERDSVFVTGLLEITAFTWGNTRSMTNTQTLR